MRISRGLTAVVIVAAIAIATFVVIDAGGGLPGPATPGTVVGDSSDAATDVPASALDATVDYVHDGDTLFLSDETRVRLLGIDTPEIGDNLECYGDEATAELRRLLPEGAHVRVVADVQPLDPYGRSLLFLYTDDGTLVNLYMIEAGFAEAVVLPPNVLLSDQLEAAEDRAQSAGLGIWGAC